MYSLGPDHTTAALIDEVERDDHFIHSVDFSPAGEYIYWTETGKTSTNKYTMGSMRRAELVDLTTSTALNAKGGDVRHTHDGLMLTIGNLATQVYTVTDPDDATPTVSAAISPYIGQGKLLSHMALQPVIITNTVPVKERVLGHKHYELVDHLGNVRAVVSDMKYATWSGTAFEDYHAEVESRADYYAFGSLMPGRHSSTESYRYGFNGKENDIEVHTAPGTSVDFGARMYDSRIGRWLTFDPKGRLLPHYSPYHFAKDNPVHFVDPDGKVVQAANTESFQRLQAHIAKVFTGYDALAALFVQQGELLSFQPISKADFLAAVRDVSDPNVRALANGYFEAVNSKRTYRFMLVHNKKKINTEPGYLEASKGIEIGDDIPESNGSILERDNGGVVYFTKARSESLILFNEEAVTDQELGLFGSGGSRQGSRNADAAISRALVSTMYLVNDPWIAKGGDNGPARDIYSEDESIIKFQAENLVRSILGLEAFDGASNDVGAIPTDRNAEVLERPQELELNIYSCDPVFLTPYEVKPRQK